MLSDSILADHHADDKLTRRGACIELFVDAGQHRAMLLADTPAALEVGMVANQSIQLPDKHAIDPSGREVS
jgi:hypothetical protein